MRDTRIGIFGGTFNPPHVGHIQAARAAIEQLQLDKLIVIPAGIPPHKTMPEATPSPSKRMELSRIAFENVPSTIVSIIEVTKPELSYSVDTLEYIRRLHLDDAIFLLVGSDMYLTLESWKDSRRIFEIATPVVFSRKADDVPKVTKYAQYIENRYGAKTEIIETQIIDISSSALRQMLPKRGGIEYMTEPCYSYIIKNRLYNAKPGWDWLRERAHFRLDPLRIPHVHGCEEEAPRLARIWGADPDDAREAAILHDITKRLTLEESLNIFSEHNIHIDENEHDQAKLFHSRTAALLAASEFGVSDEVAEAIRWHTTGKPGMTTLEKVIYLADYIEPNRDFDGVETLRKLAYENLDEAMIMGLEMTVSDIAARGITPNTASLDALSYLKEGIANDISGK